MNYFIEIETLALSGKGLNRMNISNKKDLILTAIIVGLVVYIATRELTLSQMNNAPTLTSKQSPLQKNSNTQDTDPYEKEQVKNTLTKAAKSFQECYLNYLKAKPNKTSLQIKADWQIQPNGSVASAGIVNSEDEAMGKCLVSKINDLNFPPPPEGRPYYVAHTFTFKTVEQLEREQKEREKMEKKLAPSPK